MSTSPHHSVLGNGTSGELLDERSHILAAGLSVGAGLEGLDDGRAHNSTCRAFNQSIEAIDNSGGGGDGSHTVGVLADGDDMLALGNAKAHSQRQVGMLADARKKRRQVLREVGALARCAWEEERERGGRGGGSEAVQSVQIVSSKRTRHADDVDEARGDAGQTLDACIYIGGKGG